MSSTFFSTGTPEPGTPIYTRYDSPSWHEFEEAVAALEGTPVPGVLFGSGMAAIAATLSLVPPGGRVVLPRTAYNTTLALTDSLTQEKRIQVRHVDITDALEVTPSLSGASMLWIESPTNPLLEIADLSALVNAARTRGVLVVADNTFATPLGQQPFDFGVDIVVHSATKYLSGHSDVVLGIALAANDLLRSRLTSYRSTHGAIASAMDAWLALRGLRTLGVRVERSQLNALDLARQLQDDPRIAWVRHPSLADDPGHSLASRQMMGYGSIISFAPHGGQHVADAIVERTRLWVPATSLGGVESMLERRRRHLHEPDTVPEDLIRLSVGIESVVDLWADLDQALDVVQ